MSPGALPGDPATFALVLGLLALGPLTYAGWRRPVVLIILVMFAVAIPYEVTFTTPIEGSVALADLASIFALLVIGTRALLRSEQAISPVLAGLLAACLFASAAATFFATDALGSLAGFGRVTQMLVFVPLAAYLAIQTRADQALFLGALIVLGVMESAVAIQQFATGTGASFAAPGATEAADIRAYGTFDAANIVALPIIVTAALLASFATALWTTGRVRMLALLSLVPLVAGLLTSLSRGAWIAALGGAVVIALYKNRRATAIAVVGAVLLLAVVIPLVQGAGESDDVIAGRATSLAETPSNPDESVLARYALWDAAVEMWRDYPVTGVGIQGFVNYRDAYLSIDSSARADVSDPETGFRRIELESPHNLALLFLSEQGILGITTYGLLLALTLIMAIRRSAAAGSLTPESTYEPFRYALIGWFASFLIRSVYGDIGGPTVVLEGILIGAVLRVAFEPTAHRVERGRRVDPQPRDLRAAPAG